MKITNATWIWSDTHFGHKNIIKFQQRPETHEVIMLSHWIERVKDDDDILHLGDVLMGKQGNPKRWAKVLSRMPGRKFVIMGNHDKNSSLLESAGFTVIDPFIWDKRGVAFTHRPITTTYPGFPEWDLQGEHGSQPLGAWHTNIHGHIHKNPHRFEEGHLIPSRRYVNVSVECVEFAPRQVGSLL